MSSAAYWSSDTSLRNPPRSGCGVPVRKHLSAACAPCLDLIRELTASELTGELASSLIAVTGPASAGTLELPAWLRVLIVLDQGASLTLVPRPASLNSVSKSRVGLPVRRANQSHSTAV